MSLIYALLTLWTVSADPTALYAKYDTFFEVACGMRVPKSAQAMCQDWAEYSY